MPINSSERESIATGKTYTEKRAEKYLKETKKNKKPYKSKYKTKKQPKSKYKKSNTSKDFKLTKHISLIQLFGSILIFGGLFATIIFGISIFFKELQP